MLRACTQGVMVYDTFWTVWKLCQGIASLTFNDENKVGLANGPFVPHCISLRPSAA